MGFFFREWGNWRVNCPPQQDFYWQLGSGGMGAMTIAHKGKCWKMGENGHCTSLPTFV